MNNPFVDGAPVKEPEVTDQEPEGEGYSPFIPQEPAAEEPAKEPERDTSEEPEKEPNPEGSDEPEKPADDPEKPTEDPEKEPEAEPSSTGFTVDSFNEKFDTQLQTEEEIRSLLQTEEQYKTLQKELESYKQKYEELEAGYDPKKILPDEQLLKMAAIRKKYPDTDLSIASRINSVDEKSASDLDMAILGERLEANDSQGSDEVIKGAIARRLGVDKEELTNLTGSENESAAWELKRMASSYRNKVSEMKNVEIPQPYNWEEAKAEKEQAQQERASKLKEKWDPVIEKSLDSFIENGLKIQTKDKDGNKETLHTFTVEPDFKENVKDDVMNYVINSGMDLTRENVSKAYSKIAAKYQSDNFDKIMKDYADAREAKVREEFNKKVHNPTKPNESEAPKGKKSSGQSLKDHYSTHDKGFLSRA